MHPAAIHHALAPASLSTLAAAPTMALIAWSPANYPTGLLSGIFLAYPRSATMMRNSGEIRGRLAIAWTPGPPSMVQSFSMNVWSPSWMFASSRLALVLHRCELLLKIRAALIEAPQDRARTGSESACATREVWANRR